MKKKKNMDPSQLNKKTEKQLRYVILEAGQAYFHSFTPKDKLN